MISWTKRSYLYFAVFSVIFVFIFHIQEERVLQVEDNQPEEYTLRRWPKSHYSFDVNTSRLIDVQFPTRSTHGPNITKEISILFINKPNWFDLKSFNEFLKTECLYSNCVMVDKTDTRTEMNAIIFGASNTIRHSLQKVVSERSKDQVWIFFKMEPPEISRQEWYKDPILRNTMNWSWGYRTDSDIFRPIQVLRRRSIINTRDYTAIFKTKTKFAAWVVSNCNTKSLREQYVSKLVDAGIQVDVFGRCSKSKRYITKESVTKLINKYYLFYLSFENNYCKDYVTEKFYTYFDLDVVLVVRGGLNYSEHFDKSAFIDASNFQSAEHLAKYMMHVSRNEKVYTDFLRNKDKYITIGPPSYSLKQSGCRLCEKLNNLDQYHKVYENVDAYIHNYTCFNPKYVL